ncbi:hypothetical protein ACFPIF_19440 [Brevundimonas faecalis]|uniref:hypothetical protein n=1 Tax=Brevundimonas faecalis TaxID=947378 RepID=UPI00360AEFA2
MEPTPTPEATPTPTPETNASPDPNTGTPKASSPAAEAAPAEGGAEPAAKPEPTPEEAAAAARALVPEAADGYAVNVSDTAREKLGLTDGDPMVAALSKFAHENGKPQGWMDDMMEGAAALADAGLFDGAFDPAAEAAALGENADGRRREVEVFAESLKTRGEIDEGMYGELMSLSPTANGVKLIEYMRMQMGAGGDIPKPTEGQGASSNEAQEEARTLSRDPKYGKDRAFTADADRKWMAAFGPS